MNIDVKSVILPSKLQQAAYVGQVALLQQHSRRALLVPGDLEAVCSIELMKLSDSMKNNTVPEESHHVMPVPAREKGT